MMISLVIMSQTNFRNLLKLSKRRRVKLLKSKLKEEIDLNPQSQNRSFRKEEIARRLRKRKRRPRFLRFKTFRGFKQGLKREA